MKVTKEFESDWKKKLKVFLSFLPLAINNTAIALSPPFIKRLDYFLLLHYPNLWLTRIHFIFPITLILACISPIFGFLLGDPLQNHGNYYLFVYSFYFIYLVFYAFWMVKDISPNKEGGFWGNVLSVGAVYLCITVPYLVFTGFFWGYHYKIQTIMDESSFQLNKGMLSQGTKIQRENKYLFMEKSWNENRNYYFQENRFVEEIKNLEDRTENELQKEIVRYESILDIEGNLIEKRIFSEKGQSELERNWKKVKPTAFIRMRRDDLEKSEARERYTGIHLLSEKSLSRFEDYLLDYKYSYEIIHKGFWDRVEEEKVGKSLYFHWHLALFFLFYISVSFVFLYFLVVQFIPKDKSWLWVILFISLIGLVVSLFLFYFPAHFLGLEAQEKQNRILFFYQIVMTLYFLLLIYWLGAGYFTQRSKKFFFVGILFLLVLTPLFFYLSMDLLLSMVFTNFIVYWILGSALSLIFGAFLISRMEAIQSLPE